MTKSTTQRLTPVQKLLNFVDSFTPNASATAKRHTFDIFLNNNHRAEIQEEEICTFTGVIKFICLLIFVNVVNLQIQLKDTIIPRIPPCYQYPGTAFTQLWVNSHTTYPRRHFVLISAINTSTTAPPIALKDSMTLKLSRRKTSLFNHSMMLGLFLRPACLATPLKLKSAIKYL